jgi:hypothetical protein
VLIGWRYLAISGTKQKAEFVERTARDLASRAEHTCTAFGRLNHSFLLEILEQAAEVCERLAEPARFDALRAAAEDHKNSSVQRQSGAAAEMAVAVS